MELKFSKSTTDFQSTLWTLPMPHSNSVSVGIIVFAGTRDELWPKEAGIAHALEHMHFQGTENFPSSLKFSEFIEETGGRINAFTNKESTFYYVRVPSAEKNKAFKILNEQLNKPLFSEDKIEPEMKNIVQEIKRKYDDPKIYSLVMSSRNLYQNHPLSKETLGTEESVIKFKKSDFLKFKERYYNPANYVFIVVGNITEKESLELINKNFQPQNTPKNNIRDGVAFTLPNKKRFVLNKDIKQMQLVLSAAIGNSDSKESLYLEFFTNMISGGMSSPLFQKIRTEKGLCYEIWASINRWSDVGKFNVYAGIAPENLENTIQEIHKVIDDSKNDEKLLEKIKKSKLGKLMLQYENTADIINIAAYDIATKNYPKDYEQLKKEIEEVNINNIESAVNKYLKPELFIETIVAPKDFI